MRTKSASGTLLPVAGAGAPAGCAARRTSAASAHKIARMPHMSQGTLQLAPREGKVQVSHGCVQSGPVLQYAE
jgi:hypothetical protein